jgi:HK97 family phage prohead protease
MLKFEEDVIERTVPIELKRAPSDAGLIAGYASVFGAVDHFNEIVVVGAFTRSLAEWQAKGRMPPILWSHDPSEPIGSIITLREDQVGLFFEAQLNLKTDRGREAFQHIRANDVSGSSVGFRTVKSKSNGDGTLLLTEIALMEISVVAMPANDAARITAIKSLTDHVQLERALRGEIPIALSRGAAKRIAQTGFEALVNPPKHFNHDWLIWRLQKTSRIFQTKGKVK